MQQAQPPVAPAAAPVAAQQAPESPIVPDAEFNNALPPLSNDINAPLEPMVPVTQAPAETAPPELTQPLPALQGFDSTPLVDVTVKDAKSPEIRYETEVRGLDAVKLKSQFNGLSALRGGKGKAANATVVSARGREDEALAATDEVARLL
jgi:translocation and assembly module TamA